MPYEYILTEMHGAVGLVRLNRSKTRNVLCRAMIGELARAVDSFEADASVGALVITGDERAFAAGADIGEMSRLGGFSEVFLEDFNGGDWLRISTCRKPVIAAVAGYAFGGGCELAMMCDLILAADTACFGQLEVTVGIPPGSGEGLLFERRALHATFSLNDRKEGMVAFIEKRPPAFSNS